MPIIHAIHDAIIDHYTYMFFLVRCIYDNKNRVIEGELRCKELERFLDDHNAKKGYRFPTFSKHSVKEINSKQF